MSDRPKRAYMDGITWQHHLGKGNDPKGSPLFPSQVSLVDEANHDLRYCGIVEVEVRLIKWVVPQNLKFHKE